MHMWLWFGYDIGEFMFSSLNIVTKAGLTGACITLFVVGFLYEASKVVLVQTQHRVAKRLYLLRRYDERRTHMWDSSGETQEAGPSHNSMSHVHPTMRISGNYKICMTSYQTLLYSLHTVVGYILMLAIMVYNVYLIIAVVLGVVAGYFVFGPTLVRIHLEYLTDTRPVCTEACDINAEETTPPMMHGSLSSESELLTCQTPSCSRGDPADTHQPSCHYGSKQCPAKVTLVANTKAKKDCRAMRENKKEDDRLLQEVSTEQPCSTPPALEPIVMVVSGHACCSKDAQKEDTGSSKSPLELPTHTDSHDTSIPQEQLSKACCHSTHSHNRFHIWAKVPMLAEYLTNGNMEIDEHPDAYDAPWRWWSRLHEMMEWYKHMGIILEMTADLPPQSVIHRWLGEPVKAVIVPTHLFTTNKKGYPVLARVHQEVLLQFLRQDVQVVVSGARRCPLQQYNMYLHYLWDRRPIQAEDAMHSFSKGWEDYLQTPLQPLADNLDANTYSVFEKDPVKYRQYQKAIALALTELKNRQSENEKNKSGTGFAQTNSEQSKADDSSSTANVPQSRKFRVMVLGAGRGPLVRAAFNAADITDTQIQMVAVEKNPCALVTLAAQARELWGDRDMRLVSGDMRRAKLLEPADIIVSELLGSWGDNELSPECLDGAAHLLRPGGISIPCWYTSYAAPITSPNLWAATRAVPTSIEFDRHRKNLENLWVVFMKNIHLIADAKPVFTFKHPADTMDENNETQAYHDPNSQSAPDNRRVVSLSWRTEQAGVVHGFSGYFDCELFGGEHISIEPKTHSPGMISWFPIYIPIRTPLRFEKGEEIKVKFWRCVNTQKVWYEWIASVGERITPLHNIGGRSFEMSL